MTVFRCEKCRKDFNHFRSIFPKGYKISCGWCGHIYIVDKEKSFKELPILKSNLA